MRQLGWIVLAFAVLVATHAAVWTHLAERMRERLQQWAVALPVHRVAVEMGPMRRTGYPFSIRWTLDTPKVRANWAFGEISALASAVTVSTDIWHPDTLLIDVDGLVFDAYRRLSKDRLHVEALRGSGILGPPKTQEAVKLRFEFFDVAVGSGDPARMQIIVADVNIAKGYLRFSRSPQLELAPLGVNDVVRRGFDLVAPEARDYGVRLELELADELPLIEGDESQLGQALLNLTVNAFHAIEGGGTVRAATSFDRPSGMVRLVLKDDGRGIDPVDLSRIFELYYTTKAEGTGLGLSIAQRVIYEHGGSIDVQSEPGVGSTFAMSLPRSGGTSGDPGGVSE